MKVSFAYISPPPNMPGAIILGVANPSSVTGHYSDIVFNTDVTWNATGGSSGYNLNQTAVHEIGHALGVGHSDRTNAVMYPDYNPNNLTLSPDDISGLWTLYTPKPVSSYSFNPYTNTGTMLSTCPSEQVYVYPAVLCEQGAVLQGEWQVSGCTVSTPANTCGIVTAPSGIYASFTLKYRFRTGGGWSAWGPILYAGTRNCAAGEEPYSIGFGFGSSSSSSIGVSQSSAAIYIQLEQTEQQAGLRSASVSRPSSEIRLYNIYGTLVRTLTSQEGTAEINTSNLPDGIYFLYVFRGNAENPYIQTLRIKH